MGAPTRRDEDKEDKKGRQQKIQVGIEGLGHLFSNKSQVFLSSVFCVGYALGVYCLPLDILE